VNGEVPGHVLNFQTNHKGRLVQRATELQAKTLAKELAGADPAALALARATVKGPIKEKAEQFRTDAKAARDTASAAFQAQYHDEVMSATDLLAKVEE